MYIGETAVPEPNGDFTFRLVDVRVFDGGSLY